MTIGRIVVDWTTYILLFCVVGIALRYRLYDLEKSWRIVEDTREALLHGKPIDMPWKAVDQSNQLPYFFLALCGISFFVLIFAGKWIVPFIDRIFQ